MRTETYIREVLEMGRDFAGALLRPHGWVLVEGDMSAETLAAVSREVVTLEECVRMMNE
ncbi:MAG: hypothetical protein LN417_07435 [Candidatus Thermoplasmatota archaeon]|nr:hypothetical protein [Candidatus Thermoplasmatota archaeon]